MVNSRIAGFYQLSVAERRALVALELNLDVAELSAKLERGGLDAARADKVIENALGVYALPFGVGLNFRLNGRDFLAPMVVEEPSVVAAASNAAKMIRAGGGFETQMNDPLLVAQIELRRVPDETRARAALAERRDELLQRANTALASLVRRGGGARDIELRRLAEGHFVVHLAVDCCDAMGANLVNTAAEALGDELARLCEGELGLCILSNLSDRRLATVRARIPVAALVGALPNADGTQVADGIEAASRFAELDPYRAATHNKGVMNGVDSVVLATGNDYRAVEAGAHAYAARSGHYSPLATWRRVGAELHGELTLPLALGIVGGTLRVHEGARLALALAGVSSASELSQLCAAVGLASNLAALRALSTEGIQRGHMSLHARSLAVSVGAQGDEVEKTARALMEGGEITQDAAARCLLAVREAAPREG
ncbi:MAG TPA: hydroxymethylglutaryl-CoA reductase, degradative [Polyangiaceae bacterium]|nr:hydroxymethylglutaryl-CoA reductase, degradative [Polyangiaceae bacterium]